MFAILHHAVPTFAHAAKSVTAVVVKGVRIVTLLITVDGAVPAQRGYQTAIDACFRSGVALLTKLDSAVATSRPLDMAAFSTYRGVRRVAVFPEFDGSVATKRHDYAAGAPIRCDGVGIVTKFTRLDNSVPADRNDETGDAPIGYALIAVVALLARLEYPVAT